MTEPMIKACSLVKQYGEVTALDGVDLQVQGGTIYALLGPNGAGKTTMINILTTLIQPTAGDGFIAGNHVVREAEAVRRIIGVTFQDLVLDRGLTGRQVLDIHGRLYHQPREVRRRRIEELIDLIQLGDAIDRNVKTYSGGMQRRLELARGLMTDPQIIFLDEPTQGLDPQNRAAIWDYIRSLRQEQGLTILLTTHFMEEAEALADMVGIIDHGHKVIEGTPEELVAGIGADVISITGKGNNSHFLERLQNLDYIDQISQSDQDGVIQIGVDNGARRIAEIVSYAGGNGYSIEDIVVARPSLGDVFLKYTGRALRDE
ncbi:MAG: ATP-binding cassette domain-containing protein [Chloroflexota bacterium]